MESVESDDQRGGTAKDAHHHARGRRSSSTSGCTRPTRARAPAERRVGDQDVGRPAPTGHRRRRLAAVSSTPVVETMQWYTLHEVGLRPRHRPRHCWPTQCSSASRPLSAGRTLDVLDQATDHTIAVGEPATSAHRVSGRGVAMSDLVLDLRACPRSTAKRHAVHALRGVDGCVGAGDLVVVMGPSGSGKSEHRPRLRVPSRRRSGDG